jgi:hypothetical protein
MQFKQLTGLTKFQFNPSNYALRDYIKLPQYKDLIEIKGIKDWFTNFLIPLYKLERTRGLFLFSEQTKRKIGKLNSQKKYVYISSQKFMGA